MAGWFSKNSAKIFGSPKTFSGYFLPTIVPPCEIKKARLTVRLAFLVAGRVLDFQATFSRLWTLIATEAGIRMER
jgi:hypothetical protein